MRRATELARKGWGQTAPNPMVGAVVVRDGEIVGEGYHPRFGGPHAEVVALESAGDRARGATLYVTLEPCNHEGKTPPCTRAILAAGIARVVAAVRDPNPSAAGGADYLRAKGVTVELGAGEQAARDLAASFLFAAGATRPFVTLKLALSLEGAVSDAGRSSRWLSGDESRREVHRLRADADAIAVGARTVIADDSRLTVRGPVRPRRAPARVVFDRRGIIPLDSQVVRTARETPTIVVTTPGADTISRLRSAGVSVVEAVETLAALESLRREGILHLLVEGGASLAADLLGHGLVDRLVIFQTRTALGPGGLKPFDRIEDVGAGRVIERARFGSDEMTVYGITRE